VRNQTCQPVSSPAFTDFCAKSAKNELLRKLKQFARRLTAAGFSFQEAMMKMTREQRKHLPKAALVSLEWARPILCQRPFFQKNRLANAVRLRAGNLVVVVRMPWLEHSARQLYPSVFDAA
jgi:hypothetical protein